MEKVNLNFGPILGLVNDDTISEIMINQYDKIFFEKDGRIQSTNIKFASEADLLNLIHQIAGYSGRTIHEQQPYMDGYLPSGSRVNAVLPPMAPRGANLTIRKFRKAAFTLENYLSLNSLSHKAAFFLHAAVRARMNIVISGGTGTGKTTFLGTLANLVPHTERIISIEDVAEMQLQHPNWVRLESVRNPASGINVTTRDCVINALRMRPDRILVGECRRDETFEMLQAMNTGHDGSMTTVHSNSPRDCLARIESLIFSSSIDAPLAALRKQMASAIQIVVQLKRTRNGQRIVQEIVEITGVETQTITTQQIFTREKPKDSPKVPTTTEPELNSTGLVPTFVERFVDAGIQFPPNFFDKNSKINYREE